MAAAAVLVLGSCSEGQYWTEPADKGQVIAFVKPAETVTLAATDNLNSFTVKVNRSQSTGDLDVPVTFTTKAEGVLSGPASVSFKSGEYEADYTISIGNLVPGNSYTATLNVAVPEGTITHPDSRNLTFTFTISKTLSWTSLGMGTYYDGFVMDNVEAPYSVEIQKADGLERYRAVEPYKEYYATAGPASWGDWIASSGPQYVEFWENETGGLSFSSFATGLNYEAVDGQAIGAYSWTAFTEGSGYTGENDMWYQPGFAVLSPVYYVPGVGGFGQIKYAVQIELPQ